MTDDRFERLQRLAEQYAIERDAFEAKDRKINELHARIAELEIIAQYAGEDNAMAEHYAARIAELEAALKPFADKVEYTTGTNDDDYMDPVFKLGECRAARAAYLGEKK
jgi:phage host-nuclease inhibitor protein Gam